MQESRLQQLESRRQELLNSLSSDSSIAPVDDRRQLLEARRNELLSSLPEQTQDEFSYPRFLSEKVAQGITNIADMPHIISDLANSIQRKKEELSREYRESHPEMTFRDIKRPAPPEIPALSPMLREKLRQSGVDIETQKPTTPTQRMLGKGAEVLGESAIGPLRSLAGRAAIGATIGSTAGGLEEFGANPTAAMLGATIGVPTVTGIAKGAVKTPLHVAKYAVSPEYRRERALHTAEEEAIKYLRERVGEENIPEIIKRLKNVPESPIPMTTAEKAKDVGLAQAERAIEAEERAFPIRHGEATEAVHEKLKGIIPEEYNIDIARQHAAEELRNIELARDSAIDAFEPKLHPAEAGEKVGKEVRGHYKELREARHKETAPLYEEVKKIEKLYPPKNAMDAIELELTDSSGNIKKALLKAKKHFGIESEALSNAEADLKSFEKHGNGPFVEAQRKLVQDLKSIKPIKMKNAISALSDDIKAAEKAGREAEATVLKKIRKAAMEDIGKIPEEAIARAKYAEHTGPIKERQRHPVVGKILKKDFETKNYLIGESEIPSRLINKSMKTKEYAKDYIETYGNRKNVLDDTKKYINHDVVESITNQGNVDLKALEKWKKDNPYYQNIYPELKNKLDNAQNAQKMINDAYVKNMKESDSYYKGAFKSFMHHDPRQVIRSVFESPYKSGKFDRVIEIAKKDKSGDSMEAIKRAVIDDLMTQTKSASLSTTGLNNFIPNQFIKYMEKNRKNMSKVFDENQMKLLDQITDYMHRKQMVSTAGFAKGSPTSPNRSIVEMMSDVPAGIAKKMLSKIYGVGKIVDFIDADIMNMTKNAKRELIKEALLDSDRALYLLEKPINKEGLYKAYEKIKDKSFLAVPIGLATEKEEE